MKRQGGLLVLWAFVAAWLVGPSHASACGGFFCSGPSSCTGLFCTTAPTQQTGENLLFSIEDDGTLNVHIQILYQGESARFAWILPLPSVPTSIDVGTDDLFTQLQSQTAPRFEYDTRLEGACRRDPMCDVPDAGRWWGAGADAAAADAGGSGPTIHLREEVGPYDAVVLESGSSAELLTWLRDNSFDIPTAADPLVAEYVAARHVFVAIRLLSDRAAGEIQPLVLHYAEGQPCVPIRMTALAATPDMPITAYFLADARVAPINYSLIEPTFDDSRLWSGALDYSTYISNEVDDAGGHAFVTDYAGAVPSVFLTRASIADLATELDPMAFLSQLLTRGFANDAQLLAILPRFLPPPDGMTAQQYYQCLSRGFGATSATCGYVDGFDPAALVMAIEDQIIEPRMAAQEMLARHPRLTRLFTTMSPEDMSLDPLFRPDGGLPAVTNVHRATIVTECSAAYVQSDAPQRLELPSGRSERFREGRRFTDEAAWCIAIGRLPPPARSPGVLGAGGGGCTVSPAVSRGRRDREHATLGLAAIAVIALVRLRRTKKKMTGRNER